MTVSVVRSRRVAVALFAFLGTSGCDSLTGNKEKSIAITVDNAALSVGQGTRDSILITVTRTNFDNPITLSVEGTLPVGVTRSFSVNPIPAGGTQSYLRFVAGGGATPGSAQLTIRATGDGVPEKAQLIDLTVTLTGSYTMSVLSPSLTVAQGGAGDAMVLLTRTGGNASNVSLVVSGAPPGAIAAVASPTSDRAATLAITAGVGTPPGTYPITITSSAPGITPDQTTQFSLVVISPPSTTSITLTPFCSTDMPIWFAFQNEGFGWQRVTPSGNSFTFAATQKVAIAFVFQGGNEFQANLYFASRAELQGLSDRDCDGTKTLTGTVSGLTAGQSALVRMGANSTSTTSGNYTLQGVAARPLDLIATRGVLSEGFLTPDKMIVRRSQDLAGTIPALDFTAAEAFVPATSNLSVSGFTTGFGLEFFNTFWSATSTYATVHSAEVPGGTTTFSSVPASQLVADDTHELLVHAFQTSGQLGHALYAYFAAPGDRTETLGPLMTTPTVTTPTASPYARVRGQLASQAEYGSAVVFGLEQGLTGSRRFLLLVATAGYFGARPATWDVLLPDFSAVSGFTASWMMGPGPSIFDVQAWDGRGEVLFGAIPVAGDLLKLAYRTNLSATLLRQHGSQEIRVRRTPGVTQYFRR